MKRSRQVHLELAEKYDWVTVPVTDSKEETENAIWQTLLLHLPPK